MRRIVNNVISVIYSFIKFSIIKVFNAKNFEFDMVERFSPNVVTEFNKGSSVHIGKQVRVHSGTKIKVRSGARLFIGDNVKMNYNCIIACHEKISIGEGTEFGPSVYLYDHDHDFRVGLKKDKYKTGAISIGKDCWLGANTIILRGTTIGDNCVIGAGCVVNGNIPNNSVLVQKKQNTVIDVCRRGL